MRYVFVFIASLIILSPKAYAKVVNCPQDQCIIVVDAGSTGSRAHLYAYDLDSTNSASNIKEIWSKKINPGLAMINVNQNTVDAYLQTLFAGSPNVQQVPVYFYATAGMRLLPASKQKMIYGLLQHWFIGQSTYHLIEAKTIPGSQEALFDWLAVNYNLGTLQALQSKKVGVMDMGGASVQIVFPVSHSSLSTKSQAEFDIYGQHLILSVHSFLGLGQNEMAHQFLNSPSCFSNDYPLPDGELGQGDALACEQGIASLMNSVHGVNAQIKPLLDANPIDEWYSIGGISYVAGNDDLFDFEDNQLTNHNLLQQADNAVCHQQWDALEAKYPNDENLYRYCLLSAYYYALMVDGYGISNEENIHFLPQDKAIDWTTGVVLHH